MEYWNETTINAVSIGINQLDIIANNFSTSIDYIIKNPNISSRLIYYYTMMIISLYININIEISKFKYNLSIHQLKNPKRYIELYGYNITNLIAYNNDIYNKINTFYFIEKFDLTVDETDIVQKRVKGMLEKIYQVEDSKKSKLIDKISYILHTYSNNYTKKLEKIFNDFRYDIKFLNKYYIIKLKRFKYHKDDYIDFDLDLFEYMLDEYIFFGY